MLHFRRLPRTPGIWRTPRPRPGTGFAGRLVLQILGVLSGSLTATIHSLVHARCGVRPGVPSRIPARSDARVRVVDRTVTGSDACRCPRSHRMERFHVVRGSVGACVVVSQFLRLSVASLVLPLVRFVPKWFHFVSHPLLVSNPARVSRSDPSLGCVRSFPARVHARLVRRDKVDPPSVCFWIGCFSLRVPPLSIEERTEGPLSRFVASARVFRMCVGLGAYLDGFGIVSQGGVGFSGFFTCTRHPRGLDGSSLCLPTDRPWRPISSLLLPQVGSQGRDAAHDVSTTGPNLPEEWNGMERPQPIHPSMDPSIFLSRMDGVIPSKPPFGTPRVVSNPRPSRFVLRRPRWDGLGWDRWVGLG